MQIPLKDYEDNIPAITGEYITINHTACTAGEDKRNRLWVKNDGKYAIAYCHNCGLKGFTKLRSKAFFITNFLRKPKKEISFGELSEIPIQKRIWLYDYGFGDNLIAKYGIKYSKSTNRIVFTYKDTQIGRALDKLVFPKYLSRNRRGALFMGEQLAIEQEPRSVIIVEDILSAFKILEHFPGLRIVCLCGTGFSKIELTGWLDSPKIYIWLDGDRPGQKAAAKLYSFLSQFYLCRIIKTEKDPKAYNKNEMETILSI
jgi:hypothetical protein